MSMLTVSRVKVAVDGGSADGLLVLNDEILVAVLACLEEDFYGTDKGRWHLEAGFGRCNGSAAVFDNKEAALRWIAERLGNRTSVVQ